jgi:hypothetical protein
MHKYVQNIPGLTQVKVPRGLSEAKIMRIRAMAICPWSSSRRHSGDAASAAHWCRRSSATIRASLGFRARVAKARKRSFEARLPGVDNRDGENRDQEDFGRSRAES